MTQDLAYTWRLVTWKILTSGMIFLSSGHLLAPTGLSRFSLPTMIMMWSSWLERVRGPCEEEFGTPTMSVMLFRMVVLIVLDRGPRASDFLVSLMKNSSRSMPMDRVLFGSGTSWMRRDARDPSQSWTITLSPSRGSEMGRCEASLVSWSLWIIQTFLRL